MQAFLAFTSFKSHAWRGSPFWHREPPLLARASQTKKLPFPPCGRRVSPIQAASFHLQSGDGECLPTTQLYLSVFTCPTVSLDLPLDADESLPARRPYLFHPTAGEAYPSRPRVFSSGRMLVRASWPHNLPFRLYLSNTASLDLPLDAGESLPARQPYLSNLLLDEAYPSDTAILKPQSDIGESLRDRQTFLFHPAAGKAYPTTLPVDCEAFRPLNFALLSKPSDSASPDLPTDAGESTPGQTILSFQSPRLTRLTRPTQQFWNHSRMSARASQPDNLTFPSPKLGEAYPSDTAIAEATVGRRREPPSQTILPFKVPCAARLTRPTQQLLKPPSDVGESLPARQTHPFRLLAPRYQTPSNATCPAVQAILAFSPLPARFNHPTHKYWSHVGCRKSLPAGQPHLFLLRQRS